MEPVEAKAEGKKDLVGQNHFINLPCPEEKLSLSKNHKSKGINKPIHNPDSIQSMMYTCTIDQVKSMGITESSMSITESSMSITENKNKK